MDTPSPRLLLSASGREPDHPAVGAEEVRQVEGWREIRWGGEGWKETRWDGGRLSGEGRDGGGRGGNAILNTMRIYMYNSHSTIPQACAGCHFQKH